MPRGSEIPEGIRARIVDSYKAGIGYKLIAKDLDVHLSSVKNTVRKWKQFKTVATLPRSGRPLKSTANRQHRTVREDVHAGPADDRGGDLDDEERKHNTVPDAAENTAGHASDTKASDEDFFMCEDDHVSPEAAHRVDNDKPEDDKEHSSEPEDEDSMGQAFEPNWDEQRKIYAGSSVTVGSLLLLLLTFILKHDLSRAATKDLLDLLNLVVPGCVPTSLRLLKKHFTDRDKPTEIHFYCSECTNYLGVDPGTECGVCQRSLNRRGLREKACYFLVNPLEAQLRNILGRVRSKPGAHLSEVNAGGEYKRNVQEGSITLTFKCDRSPLLDSSEISVWSVLCAINELPFAERCENVMLHTLWFGREKPEVRCLLTPFINELHALSREGLVWQDPTGLELSAKVKMETCVCDSETRSTLQNFQSSGEEFGCGFCYHRGEPVEGGRGFARVYPMQVGACDWRHGVETECLAKLAIENDCPQMGVKGQSPLLLLPSFDIIRGFSPDYMHCFCLGVVPEFVDLWFNPLYAGERFHLTPQHLSHLDEALCAIQPPQEAGGRPGRLGERTQWDASEWRAFALLYSPVVLKNILPGPFYEHWMLLICAVHALLSRFATEDKLASAQSCLVQFVAAVPPLYGLEHCSFNCHLLTHLAETVRERGLPWANSSFVFQDANRRLLRMFSSSKSAPSRIFQNFLSYQEVIEKGGDVLQNAGAEIKDLFCSMTSCETLSRSSEMVGGHVTLGCGSLRPLTLREMAALQRKDQSLVTEFRGFVYKNMSVTSSDQSAACERNNSVIETTLCGFALVESVVVVEKLCSCQRPSGCSCRELVVFCKKLLRANAQPTVRNPQIDRNIAEFLVRVESSDDLCAVTCGDVVAKYFMMEQKGQLYVMRLPVFESH